MVEDVENVLLFEEIMGIGGSVGVITLNRPEKLNALTLEMCIAIDGKLAEWEQLGHIKAVVVRGEGEKAFCAGGDLGFIYDQGKSGIKKSRKFFWHEFRMNRRIHHFTKPYIALMHGITMGGGVGLSVHGTHRVGAQNLLFAMPETGIGYFPDVGASYVLPRCTGNMGIYLALTGARLHIADALYAGVVDQLVPKENFDDLITAIVETKFNENINMQVSDLISTFSMDADSMDIYKPDLLKHRNEINHCFAPHTVEEIMEQLIQSNSEWCQEVVAQLLEKSPTSLKVTLKEMLLGSQMDFDDSMKMEYRLALRFLEYHDFYEGIRCAIIEKGRKPVWRPNDLESLTKDKINEFFAPLQRELSFKEEITI